MNLCERIGRLLGMNIPLNSTTIKDCEFQGLNEDGTPWISYAPDGGATIKLVGWKCVGPRAEVKQEPHDQT